jgi:hypothetical protein
MAGGDYLLRGYTRLMESSGEEYFFKKTIRIGAPFASRYKTEVSLEAKGGRGNREATFRFRDLNTGRPSEPEGVTFFEEIASRGKILGGSGEKGFSTTLAHNPEVVKLEAIYDGRSNTEFVAIPPSTDDFDVAFLPEGGNMICGRPSRVAFKAINSRGIGCDVAVTLVNSRGDTLGRFPSQHLGMGAFVVIPEEGVAYHALCKLGDVVKRFDLPKALSHGATLRTDRVGGRLQVQIVAAPSFSAPLNIVVQSGGTFIDAVRGMRAGQALSVARERLPQGVVQILLLDAAMRPLSERLVFNADPARAVSVAVTAEKPVYGSREHIRAGLRVTAADGTPLAGNFSVSVTDDRYVAADSDSDIFSTLLLTSELRGHIEAPADYFRDADRGKLARLDLLMMTQGWSRYDVEAILRGEPKLLPGYIELGPVLSGELRGNVSNRPVGGGYPVSLTSFEILMLAGTVTDSLGRFSFDLPEAPEGTRFLVQGMTPKGRKYVKLSLDEELWPEARFSVPHPLDAVVSSDADAEAAAAAAAEQEAL